MTTVACDRKTIAADSCITYDDLGLGAGQHSVRKLHRIGKSIFGERGENMRGVSLALEWFKRGRSLNNIPVMPTDSDFYLLELSPKGIFLWDWAFSCDEILEPNFAIGSGAKAALYCMRVLKMPPLQAVQEASKVDAYTKAPFDAMNLGRARA